MCCCTLASREDNGDGMKTALERLCVLPKQFFPLLTESISSPSSMTMVHGLEYGLPGRPASGIEKDSTIALYI